MIVVKPFRSFRNILHSNNSSSTNKNHKLCHDKAKEERNKEVKMYLNNKPLLQVRSMKYFVIIFDHKLTFREHINYMAEKCTKLIFSLSKSEKLNLLKPTGHVMHQQVLYSTLVLSAHTVFMCFFYLRINSDLRHLYHKVIGFYNRDEKCLQRGKNCIFK